VTSAVGARPATITGRTTLFPARLGEPKIRTLDQLVVATLDERRLRGVAPCLVCGERSAAEGACPSCGSELS
jgi:hypothetical protein